ncbi:DNA methylase [Burkholderia ubonensis]|uniref:DNA methylase n=1 Tax=Burkholderia ubonensis TaxID=101571 RepID=UPI000A6C185A|nr:DNA methylase [Burkholderia ubonensis]
MQNLDIINPKRNAVTLDTVEDDRIFPYYAGYSYEFADRLISSLKLRESAVVLDPWNGSGTTTISAYKRGIPSVGFDLNPAMVVVARARLMSPRDIPSISPIAEIIVRNIKYNKILSGSEPLTSWFTGDSASSIRGLERSIYRILVSASGEGTLSSDLSVENLSDIAAFFYVACFRVIRRLIAPFFASNPTWIKRAKSEGEKICVNEGDLCGGFIREIELLLGNMRAGNDILENKRTEDVQAKIGNAESIRLSSGEVDAVLTSPPYCTRIDYAVATLPELAILGFSEDQFDALRRSLMGTSTVNKEKAAPAENWGAECNNLLDMVARHESKASSTYYYKNLSQYFYSLRRSLGEISRVLKSNGQAFLVVQDSYYKDVHINLALIVSEMLAADGMSLWREDRFESKQTMAGINSRAKVYKSNREPVESVLCFVKG